MKANWKDLLANRTVQKHSTSKQEIESLRELVSRDLKDANIGELSPDRRFATAYNAVLQLSKMAIVCAGYRVATGVGHHQKTFEAVRAAVSCMPVTPLTDYFETCRRRRNKIDYDGAEIVSGTEVAELLEKAHEFQKMIENWISDNYPTYKETR